MQRLLILLLAALVLHGCAVSTARIESTYVDSDDLQDAAVLDQQSKVKTLFVFDIDDTVLTAEVFFGSDYWYEWQKELDNTGSHPTVPCRFDILALTLEAGTQKQTQPDAPQIFNGIRSDKLFLTARSPNSRGATERELNKAGYALPAMLGAIPDGIIFNWANTDAKRSATVSYHHGIYMVTGQDKGKLLLYLLAKLQIRYERVILVDDGQKNIDAMQQALAQAGIAFHGIHYTRIKKPQPVPKQLVGEADRAWANLSRYLQTVFPQRYARITAGECAY